MFRAMTAALAVVAVLVAWLALSGIAVAHERRQVGPYQFVVGFLEEPTFVGAANGVSLRVTDTRVTPAKPIEGLHETLRVEVFHAGLTRSLSPAFRAVFGQPGSYAADFIPTAAGSYQFRITGRVEDLQVDERFESGPGRFDEARDPTTIQYPDQVPVGGDLSAKIADLEGQLGWTRAIAVVALVLALVVPAALAYRSRRPR